MAERHTPGPWDCEPGVDGYFAVYYEGDRQLPTSLANARLIGSAPALLEVARDLAARPCETASLDDLEVGCCATCRARQAISQAEGGE